MKTACGQYLRPSDQGISRSVEAGQDLLIYEPTQGGLRVCQNAESGPPKINSLSGAPPCVRDRARRNGEPRPPSASLDLDTIASQLLKGLGIRAHQPVRASIHDQVYPWFRVNLGNVIQDQSVSFCPRPIADPQVRLPTRPPRFAQGKTFAIPDHFESSLIENLAKLECEGAVFRTIAEKNSWARKCGRGRFSLHLLNYLRH